MNLAHAIERLYALKLDTISIQRIADTRIGKKEAKNAVAKFIPNSMSSITEKFTNS